MLVFRKVVGNFFSDGIFRGNVSAPIAINSLSQKNVFQTRCRSFGRVQTHFRKIARPITAPRAPKMAITLEMSRCNYKAVIIKTKLSKLFEIIHTMLNKRLWNLAAMTSIPAIFEYWTKLNENCTKIAPSVQCPMNLSLCEITFGRQLKRIVFIVLLLPFHCHNASTFFSVRFVQQQVFASYSPSHRLDEHVFHSLDCVKRILAKTT